MLNVKERFLLEVSLDLEDLYIELMYILFVCDYLIMIFILYYYII